MLKESFIAPDARILVVDDSKINLKMLQDLIKSYKIHVDVVDTGDLCIEYIKKKIYDIIFMDYFMPVHNGIWTLRKIRELNKQVPVILLTGDATEVKKNLEIEFQDYILKPIRINELETILLKFIPKEKIKYYTKDIQEKPKSIANYIKLPDVDVEEGIIIAGDNIDAYINTLEVVYYEGIKRSGLLVKYLMGNNIDMYKIEVHTLKSIAKTIGAYKLYEHVKKHEAACKENNIQFMKSDLSSLINEYEKLLSNINKLIIKPKKLKTEYTKLKQNIDITKLKKDLNLAVNSLEDFNTDKAIEILTSLSEYDLSDKIKRNIKKAIDYSDNFSYLEAIDTIKILLKED